MMFDSEIVFNDVSIATPSTVDYAAARYCFEEFVSTIGRLIDERLAKPVMRSRYCLQDAEISTLAGSWAVADWLDDPTIDRDQKHFIWALDTKIPAEKGLYLNEDEEEALIKYEFRAEQVNGPDVYALGIALQTNHILVSVPTAPIWDTCQIDIYICEGDKLIRKAVADHASRERHCEALSIRFNNRRLDLVTTAADFIREKMVVFPCLTFSPDIDEQVVNINMNYLLNAIAKLSKMNETACEWRTVGSAAPIYRFQWRPESTTTMNNPALRRARIFRKPLGGIGVFEHHLDFSDRHRIHFIEDRSARTFIVGYIGDHLPTTKHRH
jgi:hypothetical protein